MNPSIILLNVSVTVLAVIIVKMARHVNELHNIIINLCELHKRLTTRINELATKVKILENELERVKR